MSGIPWPNHSRPARLILVALVMVGTVGATNFSRRLDSQSFCRAGQVVRLTHRYGNIRVRPAEDETLTVSAVAVVEAGSRRQAESFAEQIELSLADWADTLFVAVLYPVPEEPADELSYEVDIDLALPAGVGIEISNAFGDVYLAGITGGSSVSNRYGSVEFHECRDISVNVCHGDVRVTGSSGALSINCSYGDVHLDEVADRVEVDSRYGDVTGQKLDGDITIRNVMGSIATDGGRGRWYLVSHHGQVAARLGDSLLTKLDIIAELARVRLLVPRVLPFRIEGRLNSGEIGTAYPLETSTRDGRQEVAGSHGNGGPHIVFTGAWADFFIGPDSTGITE